MRPSASGQHRPVQWAALAPAFRSQPLPRPTSARPLASSTAFHGALPSPWGHRARPASHSLREHEFSIFLSLSFLSYQMGGSTQPQSYYVGHR